MADNYDTSVIMGMQWWLGTQSSRARYCLVPTCDREALEKRFSFFNFLNWVIINPTRKAQLHVMASELDNKARARTIAFTRKYRTCNPRPSRLVRFCYTRDLDSKSFNQTAMHFIKQYTRNPETLKTNQHDSALHHISRSRNHKHWLSLSENLPHTTHVKPNISYNLSDDNNK